MNDLLDNPSQLKGSWDSALFMSYGVDLPYFERVLWKQFYVRCRNKIILADGNKLLEAFSDNEQSRIARYLNKHYVVEGIVR